MIRDFHKLRADFKDAVGSLPNYKRAAVWEFVNAKDERIAELEADIKELTKRKSESAAGQVLRDLNV